jgi:hypothetical protein
MIEILSLISINLVWLIYSLTEGIREGHFKHFENLKRRRCDTNIDKLFKLQRLIVLGLLSMVTYYLMGLNALFFVAAGLFFTFSYLHNGSYHCTRNSLEPENYKCGFKDGKTDWSLSTFRTYKERIIFFLTGIALQTFMIIFL